jgi:hypothetical protein
MPALTHANYVFLPWVRQGMASGIQTPDSLGANQAGVATIPVTLRINGTEALDRNVRLHGPGDVTGIDPQQVVRTEPRHLATDFEPNYFPAVEFDRPDFPWLFTPARADATGLLRPWLCLVVVRKQDGVRLRVDRTLPLPVLEISAPARPARELPDLAESWAWAHAQVTGSQPQAEVLRTALAGDPALTVSRLLCPRRLEPLTEYLACVVPTFELGRKAGLGLPIQAADENALQPAWGAGAQALAQVTLPVYFHWEFRTGTGGDFETLVRLLTVREASDLPPGIGKRRVDISQPGFRLSKPLPPGTTLEMEGALRLLGAISTPWPDATRTSWQTDLQKILNAPWQAMQQVGKEPLLAPPLYGCWQAAQHTVALSPVPPAPAPAPPWLHALNLDPRYRAAAALGTAVVQAQQEQLMAAAWEQLGEIERLNQMRRQAQLGRAVNGVYHAKNFGRFSAEELLNVAASAQARLVVAGTATTAALLSRTIAQSALPDRAVSAPLRRLSSPRGVLSARFRTTSASSIDMVGLLSTTTIVPLQKPAAGLVTLDQVGVAAGRLQTSVLAARSSTALTTTPPLGDFTIVTEGSVPKRTLLDFTWALPSDSPEARAFRAAAQAHHTYLAQQMFGAATFFQAPPVPLPDKAALLHSLNPTQTLNTRVQASLRLASDAGPEPSGAPLASDPCALIMEAPEFPQPMYEALRDLAQEWLFPGLEQVPPNTVALLETNPAFIEAFLVGLNAEMSRELLWRNYPTDQRGTYFQQFWDTSVGSAQPHDIAPIHQWGHTSHLGTNAHAGTRLVLLLRGELLRRYPNAVVYAVQAVLQGEKLTLSTAPQAERHPLFRGTLQPDVTFLGFDLTREQALDGLGYFFVIQQQPTEPRFGLDEADFTQPLPPLTTWNNLSWRHLADTREALQALSHASIRAVLPDVDKAKWSKNAAHQAYITMQRPVRIALHARDLLTQESR